MSRSRIEPAPNPNRPPELHQLDDGVFEELCCALFRREPGIVSCERYGTRGQFEHGVDLVAYRKDGLEVGQCKCYQDFPPRKIREVSDRFLASWERWQEQGVKRFILFVACTLDERERQEEILKQKQRFSALAVQYEVWSSRTLAHKLENHPAVVATYFQPPAYWVEKLCGRPWDPAAVRGISARYPSSVGDFRAYYIGSEDKPAPFGGRSAELAALDAWVGQADAPRYALLCARAGRGKSALLVHWVDHLQKRETTNGDGLMIAYFPISARYNTNREGVVFSSLAARLAELHGDPPVEADDAHQYHEIFLDSVRRKPKDDRKLLVILDGLDEAAGWHPGHGLFPAQPPPHLRVVVAARPLAEDHDEQGWLRRLGWSDPGLAEVFTLPALQRAGIEEALTKMGGPLASFAQRTDVSTKLLDLTGGDPLLVRLYVDDLAARRARAEELSLEALAGAAPGLDGVFSNWLDDQRRLWGDRSPLKERDVLTFLNLCATALGPLRRRDVRALAPETFGQGFLVQEVARDVGRFVVGDGEESGYVFSHPRLADYFREKFLDPDELQAWQERFLRYGAESLARLKSGDLQPEDTPAYAVRYYGSHLDQSAAAATQTYDLVCEEWLRAWVALEGTPSGFLDDVRRAWKMARIEGSVALGQQARAALCAASVASQNHAISVGLLTNAARTGLLNLRQGTAIARQQEPLQKRVRCLFGLSRNLPRPESLELAAEALQALATLDDDDDDNDTRKEILVGLADQIPEELLKEALDVAKAIHDRGDRAVAIRALAGRLPEELLAGTLQALPELFPAGAYSSYWEERCEVLAALVKRLPQNRLDEALAAALEIREKSGRRTNCFEIFLSLIERYPADRLGEILSHPLDDGSAFRRVEILAAIARRSEGRQRDEKLKEALELAKKAPQDHCAMALTCLAGLLPENLLQEALRAARQISLLAEEERAQAICALAMRLPQRELILADLLAETRDEGSWEGLSVLAQCLPEEQAGAIVEELLKEARESRGEKSSFGAVPRDYILRGLTPRLPARRRFETLELALGVREEETRSELIEYLLGLLPPDVDPGAVRTALGFSNVNVRRALLRALAGRLSKRELAQGLQVSLKISNEHARSLVLSGLALRLPEDLAREALAEAAKISDEEDRARALQALAPRLPDDRLATALTAARGLGDRKLRADVLGALAPRLPQRLLREALEIAREISDGKACARAEETLLAWTEGSAKSFRRESSEEANGAARGSANDGWMDVLESLDIGGELDWLGALADDGAKAELIASAARRIPPGMDECSEIPWQLVSAAYDLEDEKARAVAVEALAAHAPVSQLGEIHNLITMLFELPEILPALSNLASRWSEWCEQDGEEELHQLSNTIELFARAGREQLVHAIEALAPVIARVGGDRALHESVSAIRDVSRWWP